MQDESSGDGRPIFVFPTKLFSVNYLQSLRNHIPPNWTSANYGIEIYLQALSIIKQLSNLEQIENKWNDMMIILATLMIVFITIKTLNDAL